MHPLALLLADSRFPSGSYAHSLGLEEAVRAGLTDVPAFIAARLRLVARADARFAVEARRGGGVGGGGGAPRPRPGARGAGPGRRPPPPPPGGGGLGGAPGGPPAPPA